MPHDAHETTRTETCSPPAPDALRRRRSRRAPANALAQCGQRGPPTERLGGGVDAPGRAVTRLEFDDLVGGGDQIAHAPAQRLTVHVEAGEHLGYGAAIDAEHADQEMAGADLTAIGLHRGSGRFGERFGAEDAQVRRQRRFLRTGADQLEDHAAHGTAWR